MDFRITRTGLVASLASTLTACGGPLPLPRASAPRVPEEQSRCRQAALGGSPLLTEWSSAEKANLQARFRAGALAVEFTGCNMRPIMGCNLRGSYRWQRTTLSSEGLEIRDQNELFAKLPLGAVALEGELSRSGRLAVRTMVSGQYVLEGSSIADVPDYGDCAAATHLVTGVSIGSFKLNSGGELSAGGAVGVGAYGVGTRTGSSEILLRESGDFESCKASTDEAPEMNCSSPVQAFLVPLPRFEKMRGGGTMRVTFAAGTAERSWELRSNQQFLCRTPCTRWVNPSDSYELRTETGPDFQTVEVPSLQGYLGSGDVEVRAHPTNQGRMLGGILATSLGGGMIFVGGFLALMGGLADRSGLAVGGGGTAGIGAIAIVPGVYLLSTSSSRVEVRSDLPEQSAAERRQRGLSLAGEF